MNKKEPDLSAIPSSAVVLDSHVSTYRYAAAVLDEMHELLAAVEHPTSTKLIFQTLPKHMRRRAMSHYPKRLPRKYRAAHCAQMTKAGNPQPTRRPSRKHRRRPCNLLRDYLRRQRRHVWLETHIWHARRFHLINRWGYRLPYASCDKTYRACYRATTKHCLLQDISFHACVQLRGNVVDLQVGFQRLTGVNSGLGITAKTFLSGRREGSVELFKDAQYPAGALGRVSFMWRPQEDEVPSKRTLWLWIHPSGYSMILEELIKVFGLSPQKTVKVPIKTEPAYMPAEKRTAEEITTPPDTPLKKRPVKTQMRLQFMARTAAYERVKHYANSKQDVELCELKDTMNRFRLTGPLAQGVLARAFKVRINHLQNKTAHWFNQRMINDGDFQQQHEAQARYWQQCSAEVKCPTELMSNVILALNVDDPRIHRPQKRTKAAYDLTPDEEDAKSDEKTYTDLLMDAPSCLASSPLWESELRDRLCANMLSSKAYCDMRARNAIVPGATCRFELELQPLPVLLIQRPGSQVPQYKRLGYDCGWDVIVPAGYGMPVWMSLIMWGARPGGLREFETIARESATEQHLPDTVPGLQSALERYTELRTKYFRLPSNKRCNYNKLAIASPFRVPFSQLVRDWSDDKDRTESEIKNYTTTSAASWQRNFHVLRDRELLQAVYQCLMGKQKAFLAQLPNNCLIQLQFQMKSRGSVDDFALVCLPTSTDLKRNRKQTRHGDNNPVYTEPPLRDAHEKERKILRQQHKKLLKRMRAQRVREKRKKQETSQKRVHIRPAGTAQLVAAQFKKMCDLWLPEQSLDILYSVRRQGTREVFGYLTSAHFNYTEATVCGLGYVTPAGLQQLLTLCHQAHLKQPMCLLRSTKSRHYRFATFKLNLQI